MFEDLKWRAQMGLAQLRELLQELEMLIQRS